MGSEAGRPVPRQRTDDLAVRALAEGSLVLDRRTNTAHYLPGEISRVWDACTGRAALAEIASAAGVSEQAAAGAADQLTALDLLEAPPGVGRRRFLRRAGLVGAGALTIPVIESVVAPTAAMAQSAPGALTFSAICGVGGAAGQMGWAVSFTAHSGWDPNTQYSVEVAVSGNGGTPSSAGLMTDASGAGATDPNGTVIGTAGAFPSPGTPVTVVVTNTGSNESFTFYEQLTAASGNGGCPLPQGPFAYVANWSSGTVSVVNTATGAVAGTLTGFTSPLGVAVSPDGSRVYVTNNTSSGFVRVINTADNTMTSIPLGGTSLYPQGIAVTPDGRYVYVANNSGNSVSVIDTQASTPAVIATIPVASPANLPFSVAVAGGYAYVGTSSGYVMVIDTSTNTVATTINVGTNLLGIAAAPDGRYVYVTNNVGAGSVAVISTATNTVVANVPVGGGQLRGIAVTPDGRYVYVASQNAGTVAVIDTSTNMVATTISGFGTPYGVAVAPGGGSVYVTNYNQNTVSVINTATNTVNPVRVTVGSAPWGIAVGP